MKVRSLIEFVVHVLCLMTGMLVVAKSAAVFEIDAFIKPYVLILFPVGYTLGGTLSLVVSRRLSRWIGRDEKEDDSSANNR